MSDMSDLKAQLARAREHLISEPSARATRERSQRKQVVKKARLRRTGREVLWTFRCNPDLVERCKLNAKRNDMSIAEWMEQVLEAALAAEEEEVGRDA